MDTNKCWFVRTQKGEVETQPMTQYEALMLGDFLIANKHKGVTVYKGQPALEIR
jgi:hypothetical protein